MFALKMNGIRYANKNKQKKKITRESLKFFLVYLCSRLTEIAFQRRPHNYLYIVFYRGRESERERDRQREIDGGKCQK